MAHASETTLIDSKPQKNNELLSKNSLHDYVCQALHQYFSLLDGTPPHQIYQLFIAQVEKPLLTTVMEYAKGNQSKAAQWLGISRGTLRKLLSQYNLDDVI